MINESELPVLTEEAEAAVIVRNDTTKWNKVVHRDMNKSVSSHLIEEVIAETMFVDTETNQPTMNQPFKDELSTPELPSGTSLDEQLPTHLEAKSQEPHHQCINSDAYPKLAVESEASGTMTGSCTPERSDSAREEPPVAPLFDAIINSVAFDT